MDLYHFVLGHWKLFQWSEIMNKCVSINKYPNSNIINELKQAVNMCCYNIILVETWLNNHFDCHEVCFQEFNVYRLDSCPRTSTTIRGGGVLVASRHYISASLINIDTYNFEQFFIFLEVEFTMLLVELLIIFQTLIRL